MRSTFSQPQLVLTKMAKAKFALCLPVFIFVSILVLSLSTAKSKRSSKRVELEQVLANGEVRPSPLNQAHRRWSEETPSHDEIVKSTRIISGRYSKPGEVPYLVLISYKKIAQWCGGAIYNRDTIVTAAHCFFYDNVRIPVTDLSFTAGEHDLDKHEKTEMRRRGGSVVIPENYDPDDFPNDIAVAKLLEPLRYTYSVQPLPIAKPGQNYGRNLRIAGFGYVRQKDAEAETYSNGYSTVLKVALVPERTKDECRKLFDGMDEIIEMVNHETFYCAGGQTVGGKSADACQGDSGGPAVCPDKNNRKHLCGIVSTGYGCGLPDMPGIYTNVSFYHDFIRKHGGEPDPPTRVY